MQEKKPDTNQDSILAKDETYIWHPLTQHKIHKNLIPIVRAKGCELYDINGKSYIDAISSWYTCVYGHCNTALIEALKQQSEIKSK